MAFQRAVEKMRKTTFLYRGLFPSVYVLSCSSAPTSELYFSVPTLLELGFLSEFEFLKKLTSWHSAHRYMLAHLKELCEEALSRCLLQGVSGADRTCLQMKAKKCVGEGGGVAGEIGCGGFSLDALTLEDRHILAEELLEVAVRANAPQLAAAARHAIRNTFRN